MNNPVSVPSLALLMQRMGPQALCHIEHPKICTLNIVPTVINNTGPPGVLCPMSNPETIPQAFCVLLEHGHLIIVPMNGLPEHFVILSSPQVFCVL